VEELINKPDQKILDIRLSGVWELIPRSLHQYFLNAHIKTINNVLECRKFKFSNKKIKQKALCRALAELKTRIIEDPERFYDYYIRNNVGYVIPENYDNSKSDSVLKLFFTIVVEYSNLIRNDVKTNILIMSLGINTEKKTSSEISSILGIKLYDNNAYRREVFGNIKHLLQGKTLCKPKIVLQTEVANKVKKIVDYIDRASFHTKNSLRKFFIDQFNENIDTEKEKILEMLIGLFELKEIDPVKSSFTTEKLLIVYGTREHTVLYRCEEVIRQLNIARNPLSENELTALINPFSFRLDYNNDIRQALEILPEIQTINGTLTRYCLNKKQPKYFWDLVYKKLQSKKMDMSANEILDWLNFMYKLENNNKRFTLSDLQLEECGKFKPSQRSGWWSLAEWDIEIDSILILVREILVKQHKITSLNELYSQISRIYPNLKISTLQVIISESDLILRKILENNHSLKYYCLLPEWKKRYPKGKTPPELIKKIEATHYEPKVIIKHITLLIQNSETGKLEGDALLEKLIAEYKTYKKYELYKFLTYYFKESYSDDNVWLIELK